MSRKARKFLEFLLYVARKCASVLIAIIASWFTHILILLGSPLTFDVSIWMGNIHQMVSISRKAQWISLVSLLYTKKRVSRSQYLKAEIFLYSVSCSMTWVSFDASTVLFWVLQLCSRFCHRIVWWLQLWGVPPPKDCFGCSRSFMFPYSI